MPESQPNALAVRRVTRLGVTGIVWSSVLAVVLIAGVCWVLVASSTDPDTELQRNGLAAILVALPALVCLVASIGALVAARRRAATGRPRPALLPMLALGLLALVTVGAIGFGAVAGAIAVLTLA